MLVVVVDPDLVDFLPDYFEIDLDGCFSIAAASALDQ